MNGSPAKGYSTAVEIPANKVFLQTHVESLFYQSVASDLSVGTHIFEGSGGDADGKRNFDVMLDYLDSLGDRSPIEWRWAPPVGIDSSRLWKHMHGSHGSEWDPSGGKWRVTIITYPQIAKMQLDVKNRAFDGLQPALQAVATDSGLHLVPGSASLPIEFGRIIQSNQSDWEFVTGNLMFKLGAQAEGGVEMFTTVGDDLNLSDLSSAQEFTPHPTTVLKVMEHENSFDRTMRGGSETTVIGFDHYQKINAQEEAVSSLKMLHTGSRTVYVPSRKSDALQSWASARVQRHSGRHRTVTVSLTGFMPDEITLPCKVVLPGGFYRKKNITATAISALWTLQNKRLIVDLLCRVTA